MVVKIRPNGESTIRNARGSVATTTYRLLNRITLTPGTTKDSTLYGDTLLDWLIETRRLCAAYGRVKVGDQCLGQLLARSSPTPDGIWPSPPVCDAMEAVASSEISNGFCVGAQNARGVVSGGEGGDQERELAARYRTRAQELAIDYPYVSRMLEDLADSYYRDAQWHDTESEIAKRLPSH